MCSLTTTGRTLIQVFPFISATSRKQICQTNCQRNLYSFRFLPDILRMSSKEETETKKDEDKWLNISDFRVFAWSLSGIETSIVVKTSDAFSCCFDLGHSSRESVKCDTVFISHGHMDHIAALPHHIKKREIIGYKQAKYFVPEHLVKPLTDVCANFADLNGGNTPLSVPNIRPINPGEKIELSKGYHVIPFPTVHRVKSQGYILYKSKKVLKQEYKGLTGHEIGAKHKSGEVIHDIIQTPEVAFTGDTTFQVFTDEVYPPSPDLFHVKLLIVEATYIDDESNGKDHMELARHWGHIHLSEIYKNAELFRNIENILLIHFSDKYSINYIQKKVYENIPAELRDKVHVATLAKKLYI